jgi:glyoxylase-like metal-dependent hydrolase (beta-lactamase superfamily II)
MIAVKQFAFSPLQENTYILHNEAGKAFIIDPGMYFPAERESLKEYISTNKLTPVKLIQTHCHLDHIFGSKWVYETYGLQMHLHPLEEKVLSFGPASGQMWGLTFDHYTGPLHFLNDGDEILLGEDKLEVILAPGHSPGSICFYCKEQKFLIGGDVLFNGSIGRSDLPGGDHDTLLNSIKQRLFVLPDDVIVYSGHGPATTIGQEKKTNPYVGENAVM